MKVSTIKTLGMGAMMAIMICCCCNESQAQPISGGGLNAGRWMTPNIVAPMDVRIGTSTILATNDRYANFLRFSSPVDIDIRIEGDGRWYPDPQACLFEMGYRGAVQVASDDDSGPHRDFLIERKILAGRTYVLQVGTRTSSFTTVRITTNQIVAHGELASQSLQAVSTVEPARIGRLRDADWQTGTDFGTTVMGFGTVDRVFNIENFAVSSGTFSIDGVSISNRDDHFLYRYDTIPDSHQNSFRVSRLSNSRVRVQFNPQDAGVIEANLLIDYSMDGQSFQAQMPLVGRGSTSFASFRQVTLDGDAARMSSNFEYSLDTRTDRERYAWISLRFPEPATKVYIYIVPHGTVSSEINASFYRQGEYDRSPQLASIPGGFTYGFFDLTGDDRAGLKIDLPTTEERAISDFTVWVFAEG